MNLNTAARLAYGNEYGLGAHLDRCERMERQEEHFQATVERLLSDYRTAPEHADIRTERRVEAVVKLTHDEQAALFAGHVPERLAGLYENELRDAAYHAAIREIETQELADAEDRAMARADYRDERNGGWR